MNRCRYKIELSDTSEFQQRTVTFQLTSYNTCSRSSKTFVLSSQGIEPKTGFSYKNVGFFFKCFSSNGSSFQEQLRSQFQVNRALTAPFEPVRCSARSEPYLHHGKCEGMDLPSCKRIEIYHALNHCTFTCSNEQTVA